MLQTSISAEYIARLRQHRALTASWLAIRQCTESPLFRCECRTGGPTLTGAPHATPLPHQPPTITNYGTKQKTTPLHSNESETAEMDKAVTHRSGATMPHRRHQWQRFGQAHIRHGGPLSPRPLSIRDGLGRATTATEEQQVPGPDATLPCPVSRPESIPLTHRHTRRPYSLS